MKFCGAHSSGREVRKSWTTITKYKAKSITCLDVYDLFFCSNISISVSKKKNFVFDHDFKVVVENLIQKIGQFMWLIVVDQDQTLNRFEDVMF